MRYYRNLWAVLLLAGLVFVAGCPKKVDTGVFPGSLLDKPAVPVVRVLLNEKPFSQISVSTDDGVEIYAGGKAVLKAECLVSNLEISRNNGKWAVQLGAKRYLLPQGGLEVVPGNGMIQFGNTKYRGKLFLLERGELQFIVVNHADLEGYLAGVLPKELYPGWDKETYRALAVASRTFAMYHMLTSGVGRDYDMGDSVASQVYGGYSAETPKSREAVEHTAGIIMTAEQNGQQRVFMAQFSSCCGGWVNSAVVLRDAPDIEPLRGGQRCDDCKISSKYTWPVVRVSKQQIYQSLLVTYPPAKTLADVDKIEILSRLPHGRAVWVQVTDSRGKAVTMRAEKIRLALLFGGVEPKPNLYSMNCRMVDLGDIIEFRDGRGYGHGVGLCQFGAQGKALRGLTARQILEFYYPGAQLTKAY